ncbi:MAG: pyridoxal 5'-phosphate synthase glutaminase subunit PdxT, partial [Candidatus Eremiobacteraeota bacterium]|nr:pyridoxal 5'-phosphate synthase glutaminase subunit PdxT [Candidatus Eremiobacteraeota bacterium]
SAEVTLPIAAIGAPAFPAVFIRAPWIERCGSAVELLAKRNGHGVMVRERNVLATSFHPELTADQRVHRYFLAMVEDASSKGKSSTAA